MSRKHPPGRRTVLTAAAAGAVLVVPIVADRTAAAIAEHRLTTRLSCAVTLTDPEVSVGGFPFLTQLAGGTFADVRLRADAATVHDIALTKIDIRATGVRGSGADSITASAMIDYSGLSTLLAGRDTTLSGARLGGDDAGRLMIATSIPLRGLTMAVTVYADLTVTGDQLTITPGEVELADLGLRLPASRLPGERADPRTVPLPALPDGFTYQRISATPAGLLLAVTGGAVTTDRSTTCEGTE
ncbi:DUF2993 domain-containing protein [Catenuloplanes sp. NPDC051500]|uniref:DUF2993 domain-containing protein n=1 Tax=Catenuloplanes sp. NPDC051500 TaxID=3363959 RepID=UPI0037AA443B